MVKGARWREFSDSLLQSVAANKEMTQNRFSVLSTCIYIYIIQEVMWEVNRCT